MNLIEWLEYGIERNYCTTVACAMHDGIPTTEDEDHMMYQGDDPCLHVVRISTDAEEIEAIRKNYPENQ
jgi:hypothetical protein